VASYVKFFRGREGVQVKKKGRAVSVIKGDGEKGPQGSRGGGEEERKKRISEEGEPENSLPMQESTFRQKKGRGALQKEERKEGLR